jgi:hypothetical protein
MRTLSEPEKKSVAARQRWCCSACGELLSAAYQVDHTIPLCDGGPDHPSNTTAMCANCHALKTQAEAGCRARAARQAAARPPANYADRIDWYLSPAVVRCDACRHTRLAGTRHSVCTALEDPSGSREAVLLAKFAFVSRH